MSINISWFGIINDQNPRYMALSDNDKRFLCPSDLLSDMSVPTLILLTHIGFISEESIPHIVGRLDFANGAPIKNKLEDRSKKWGYDSLEAHLRVFIGVQSNWPTLSSSEFIKRIGSQNIPKLTSVNIQRMLSLRDKAKKAMAAA